MATHSSPVVSALSDMFADPMKAVPLPSGAVKRKHLAWRRERSEPSSILTSAPGRSDSSATASYSVAPMYAVVMTRILFPASVASLRQSMRRFSPVILMNDTTMSMLLERAMMSFRASARVIPVPWEMALLRLLTELSNALALPFSRRGFPLLCARAYTIIWFFPKELALGIRSSGMHSLHTRPSLVRKAPSFFSQMMQASEQGGMLPHS